MTMQHWLPPLPVAVPLVIGAFLAAVNRHIPRWLADTLAITASLACLAACLLLMKLSASQTMVYWFGGWIPRSGAAVGISFSIDPIGAGAAAFASLLVVAALVMSLHYFDSIGTLFHVLMLSFLAAMCGFSLTGDIFNLFVFFELMSAAAFALCGYKTEEGGPLEGALNFAVTNTIAAFLALSGIGLLYGRTGALNMAQIGRSLGTTSDGLVVVALVLIICGFGTKAALFPFHFWLADAHAVAPTPVCILFSGVMVELGLYAIARVYWTIFQASMSPHLRDIRALLVAVGVITAILGAVMSFGQRHIKRLLAFSTISHTGLMMIAIALLTPVGLSGAALYMLGHGAAKAGLFIGAGIILHRLGSVDEFKLTGQGHQISGALLLIVLLAMGLAGVPGYGTFRGELAIDDAAEKLGFSWLSYIFIFASIVTAGAVLRLAGRLYFGWGPPRDESRGQEGETDEGQETKQDHGKVPAVMYGPLVFFVLLGIFLCFVPHFTTAMQSAANRFQDQAGYAARVLDFNAPPHRPLEPNPPLLPATVRGAVATVGAFILALLTLFRHKLPLLKGRHLDRLLASAMAPIRQVHSGVIGDYVAWLTFGVAAMGGFFFWLVR